MRSRLFNCKKALMPEAFFWIFSTVAIVSALGVVFSPQAAQSAFWMFAELLGISGIMACLGAWMLSLITLLVYAGAILVLFVFVIMFMGQRTPQKQIGRSRLLGAILAAILAIILLFPLYQAPTQIFPLEGQNSLSFTGSYGTEFFGRYQILTQLAAWVILWVGVSAFRLNEKREVS